MTLLANFLCLHAPLLMSGLYSRSGSNQGLASIRMKAGTEICKLALKIREGFMAVSAAELTDKAATLRRRVFGAVICRIYKPEIGSRNAIERILPRKV